ncbi:MAG: S41 family peptidase [Bdellovibrionales bacterium]|nr:S41 family peptidase [Bdellovibrionales bacterium]
MTNFFSNRDQNSRTTFRVLCLSLCFVFLFSCKSKNKKTEPESRKNTTPLLIETPEINDQSLDDFMLLAQQNLCKIHDELFKRFATYHLTADPKKIQHYAQLGFQNFLSEPEMALLYQKYKVEEGLIDPETEKITQQKYCDGYKAIYDSMREKFSVMSDSEFLFWYLRLMLRYSIGQLDPHSTLTLNNIPALQDYIDLIERKLHVRFFRRSDYPWRAPKYLMLDKRIESTNYTSVNKEPLLDKKITGLIFQGSKDEEILVPIADWFHASFLDQFFVQLADITKVEIINEDQEKEYVEVLDLGESHENFPSTFWYWTDDSKEHVVIQIDGFVEQTVDDLRKNFFQIHRQNPNYKTIIVDIRNNGGGLLDSCIGALSLFLPEHSRVGFQAVPKFPNKHEFSYTELFTEKPAEDFFLPGFDKHLMVLSNRRTASAAELFAWALGDHKRSVNFGEREMFGKAVGQTYLDRLLNISLQGSSAVITFFALFTPENAFNWQQSDKGPTHLSIEDPALSYLANQKKQGDIFVMSDYPNAIGHFDIRIPNAQKTFVKTLEPQFQIPNDFPSILQSRLTRFNDALSDGELSTLCKTGPEHSSFREDLECLPEAAKRIALCWDDKDCGVDIENL